MAGTPCPKPIKPPKLKPWQRKDGKPKRGYTAKGKPSAKSLLNKADELAKAACRARGYCQAHAWKKWRPFKSGMGKDGACWGVLCWCHIENRDNRVLRHDPRNCLCMCAGCHDYFHKNTNEFSYFVESIAPGTHDYLLAEEQANTRPLIEIYQFWINFYKTEVAA